MKDDQETRFVPTGAIAFFVCMVLFYVLVWLTTYSIMMQWR